MSIRLLDEEYTQLLRLCQTRGARSVSDLARDAMFGLMSPASQLEGRVMELDARLVALRDEVAKLSRMVQA
ncbi:MAG: hypothetical protein NTV52_27775 [Acidobacteria bacterium]|nr:hypothetical protein [Acidobacteriota bacterium]